MTTGGTYQVVQKKAKRQEEFNQKYFGMSTQEVRDNKRQVSANTSLYGTSNPLKNIR